MTRETLEAILKDWGWGPQHKIPPFGAIWTHPDHQDIEVLVCSPEARDFKRRMADAYNTLAVVYGCPSEHELQREWLLRRHKSPTPPGVS